MAQSKHPGLFRRGSVWWIRTDPVTGKAISTGCRSVNSAELFRAERERIAASPAYKASLTATLGHWCDEYVKARKAHGLNADFATQKLGAVLSIIPRETPLAEITPEAIDRYIDERSGRGVKPHTLTKELGQLRLAMRHAARYGAWAGDADKLKPVTLKKNYVPRKRALPPEEVDALLEVCSDSLAAFVARCVAYSCRANEVYATTIDEQGRAHIAGTKTDRSDRHVPLLAPFERFGNLAKLEPHGPNNLLRDLAAACKRAKIARATPNDLRRTFDTTLSEAGVPHSVIAAFMGHAGTQMTAGVYDWARFSELEKLAVAALQNRYTEASNLRATRDSNPRPSAPEAIYSVAPETLSSYENTDLGEANQGRGRPENLRRCNESATPDRFDLLAAYLRGMARRAA